jgi:hypothetical protein
MERQATQPLNPQEAKARLRAAASGGDIVSLLGRSPQTAVLVAFIIGFAAGTSATARKALASGVVSLFTRSRPYSPSLTGRGRSEG